MSDYLKNALFAADLLNYLFEAIDLHWENPYTDLKKYGKSEFSKDVGIAVWRIWVKNEEDIWQCVNELKKERIIDKEAFGKYALSAADSYFSEGYSAEPFLGYCAIVLAAAIRFYAYPSNGVPERAVDVIALVLMAHQMTGQFDKHGGWEELRDIAMAFNCLCN